MAPPAPLLLLAIARRPLVKHGGGISLDGNGGTSMLNGVLAMLVTVVGCTASTDLRVVVTALRSAKDGALSLGLNWQQMAICPDLELIATLA